MAYITLEDLRGELDIEGTGDNPLLQEAIEDARSYIDGQTNRHFEAVTAVRWYGPDALDPWDRYTLHLGDDLLTVTTLANGDGRRDVYTPAFATDTLTLATASVYDALETGTPAVVYSTDDDVPAGLTEGTVYYVILGASPTIQLATSRANALAGTATAFTDDGSGTHTIVFGGTLIPREYIWLQDRNHGPPYHWIELRRNQGVYWDWTTDYEVMVGGTWGYSATCPDDIRRAALVLAAYFYRQKDAQMFETTAIVESGAIAIPQGIPATVDRVVNRYRKRI